MSEPMSTPIPIYTQQQHQHQQGGFVVQSGHGYPPQQGNYTSRQLETQAASNGATAQSLPAPQTLNQWRDSTMECFNNLSPSLLCAWACPCVLMGQITEKAQIMPCMATCCGYGCYMFLMFILIIALYQVLAVWALLWWIGISLGIYWVRSQFTRRYGIIDDPCTSCCLSFFCHTCVMTQMARQLYNYQGTCDAISCQPDGGHELREGNSPVTSNVPSWQRPPPRIQYYQPGQQQTQPQQVQMYSVGAAPPAQAIYPQMAHVEVQSQQSTPGAHLQTHSYSPGLVAKADFAPSSSEV